MSGNRPPRPRQNLPEPAELVPVQDQLFKKRLPNERYRDPFFTSFTSRDARRIRAKLTTTQHAVLDALLALWPHGQRDIETSIAQIKKELEAVSMNKGTQHISTAISKLQKAGALIKLKSGQNRLVIRINPRLNWKSSIPENNVARSTEATTWETLPYSQP